MKKIFLFVVLLVLVCLSVIAFPIISSGKKITKKTVDTTRERVRLIVSTNSTQDRANFVSMGCKIVYSLEEETIIDCPAAVAKNIPNATEDKAYSLMSEEILPRDAVPTGMNAKDIWDNSYLQVPKLWEKGVTGKGRVVAILDTGIDYNHPSLAKDILANVSFVDYTTDPMDDMGHGTHVAGIITSDGNPEFVMCFINSGWWQLRVNCEEQHDFEMNIPVNASKGIAPDAKIIMGKVCDSTGVCWESDILAGIEWAAKGVAVNTTLSCFEKCKVSKYCCQRTEGCSYVNKSCDGSYVKTEIVKPDVISLSLGGEPLYLFSNCNKEPLAKKINSIVKKYSIPVVVAAGKWPWGVSIPACAGNAIAAGAVGCMPWQFCPDWYNTIAEFSARGYAMKDHGVLAPAVAVLSTTPNSNFAFYTGTSMSSPYVAGMITLIKQERSSYTQTTVKNKLFRTATDVEYGFIFPEEYYKDYEQGHGLINTAAV